MNELEIALRARLTGFGALAALLTSAASVYNTVGPTSSAPTNYVVFSLNAGGPLNRSPRRAESLVYLVKGVSGTSLARAGEIDAQIDAALHDAPLTVVGWANYWLMRETRVRFSEPTAGGQPIFHAGGLYRVRIAK